ncbi:vWA domain-containing protein [Humisphaera borealis]|uniref:VWA domain-containing protein n=1 Tax=Humisphaera borealis TaxID=2807512 RepID=A0A7M2WSS6_9BACT|nr:vWA domain-containing protein [Humisphaera borealis]QOV88516.1 VWA domain-containing protein [Humisphaera borealis]
MRHLTRGFVAAVLYSTMALSPAAIAADGERIAIPKPADAPAGQPAADKPHIDVVFAIDCSGSMGAVIETAKQKVWTIVNQTAKAKPSPVLRIGLIGYGNGMGPFRNFPLTDDLDEVYKNLMTFKDEGWGSEFVGLAVDRATNEMKWADGKQTLKVIYVVGNETARQGPADKDYAKTAPLAIAKGIIVNAIYCGDVDYQNAPPTWREMAKLADGQYMEIAQTGGAIYVATPFDDELAKLSGDLNKTYCGYGSRAKDGFALQTAGDASAAGLSGQVAAERAVAKSAAQYSNARWDLVDACKDKNFKLEELKDDQLPDELKKLKPEERRAYIDKLAKEREAVQAKIKEISVKRDAHIKAEVEKKGLTGDKAFDEAVRKSLTEQAEKKGYKFE